VALLKLSIGTIVLTNCAVLLFVFSNGAPSAPVAVQQQSQAQPAIEEWRDDFDGDKLDDTKWEPFTFEGGSGGKIEVKEKQLRMRGAGDSRSGVRTKRTFQGERFYVEAALARVGQRAPRPGEGSFPAGYAIVTVLFDGNPANRLEWLLRSDGILEAWQSIDGRVARLDKGNLATKEKTPALGIARRGEKVYFMLNREVGLETTLRSLPLNFRVMLYGFGSSENNWESLAVQTLALPEK
jgi:hypothetical protein